MIRLGWPNLRKEDIEMKMFTDTIVGAIFEALRAKKSIGGPFIEFKEFLRFLKTCILLSQVGRFDMAVTVKGIQYQLVEYKIDERFSVFFSPRCVFLDSSKYSNKDLKLKEEIDDDVMPPAEFRIFQEKLLKQFRSSANFGTDVTHYNDLANLEDTLNKAFIVASEAYEEDESGNRKQIVRLTDCVFSTGDNLDGVHALPIVLPERLIEPLVDTQMLNRRPVIEHVRLLFSNSFSQT
jgi:hypothetical protein